jgi:hypothetical protein
MRILSQLGFGTENLGEPRRNGTRATCINVDRERQRVEPWELYMAKTTFTDNDDEGSDAMPTTSRTG